MVHYVSFTHSFITIKHKKAANLPWERERERERASLQRERNRERERDEHEVCNLFLASHLCTQWVPIYVYVCACMHGREISTYCFPTLAFKGNDIVKSIFRGATFIELKLSHQTSHFNLNTNVNRKIVEAVLLEIVPCLQQFVGFSLPVSGIDIRLLPVSRQLLSARDSRAERSGECKHRSPIVDA